MRRNMSSLSGSLICKILMVFLLFCLTKASGGTCLSYGHSCWGGHGKRNGLPHLMGATLQKRTGAWYLKKLFNPYYSNARKPVDFVNFPNEDEDEKENFQKFGYQIHRVSEGTDIDFRDDGKKIDFNGKSEDWAKHSRDFDEDMIFSPFESTPLSKYKLLKILDEASRRRKAEN